MFEIKDVDPCGAHTLLYYVSQLWHDEPVLWKYIFNFIAMQNKNHTAETRRKF
jgi:hypothetical protein